METRRANEIAKNLEKLVFSGVYGNGERLDELTLAEQFSVSRTPIREALQLLVAAGMAEQIPRRGVFVRQPDAVELMEMFETMAELEAACGRLAATRMSNAALNQLREASEKGEQAMRDNNLDLYYAENETFHQIIYHGSANSYLEKQALQLQNKLRAYRKMQLHFRGRLNQSMAEHHEIVSALESADADKAAAVLRTHVAVQGEKFHQLMASIKT